MSHFFVRHDEVVWTCRYLCRAYTVQHRARRLRGSVCIPWATHAEARNVRGSGLLLAS